MPERVSAVFVTLVARPEVAPRARLAIRSLRESGGELGASPVLVFATDPRAITGVFSGSAGVSVSQLDTAGAPSYPFALKVRACAQAERLARNADTLVWLDPACLFIRPPLQFSLAGQADAAFRPVHIRNIGSLASEPLDSYWTRVYREVGVDVSPGTIESFVDAKKLRPYFNTHCFSTTPATGLLTAWQEHFERLAADTAFQSGPCADDEHQVFLHQAVLSALVTKLVSWSRIRILPPEYSYPLHLRSRLPEARRVRNLNDLTVAVYEDDSDLDIIPPDDPLLSRLMQLRAESSTPV